METLTSQLEMLASRSASHTAKRIAWVTMLMLLLLTSALSQGCSEQPYELFTLDEVRPSRMEPGHRMVILGAGFPIGREVEVVFEGTVHAPFGHARHVTIRTHGHTDSPERVVTSLTESDMANLGARGTFDGSIEVSLQGSMLEGRAARVVGLLEHVTLDIVEGEPLHAADTSHSLDAAQALGFTLTEHASEESSDAAEEDFEEVSEDDGSETMARQTPRGFVIAETHGLAASAGLAAGDRVLRIDHLRVLFAHELRIAEDAPVTTLVVERAGRARDVSIALGSASSQAQRASFRYDQLAVVLIAVALLFGVRRLAPRSASAPPETTRMVGRFILGLLALLTALSLGVLPIPLGTLVLAAGLLRTLAGVFSMRGRRSHETLHEGALLLLSSLGLALSVLIFAMLSGSLDAASSHVGASRTETLLPLYWTLARHPFGPLALGLLVASATGAPQGTSHPTTRRERLLRGLDDLALALFALAFVRVSVANPAEPDVATRALGLLATTALTIGLMHARQTLSALRGRLRVVLLFALMTGAAALVWMQRTTSVMEEQAVAEVVLVILALVVVRIASLREGTRAVSTAEPTRA